MNQLEQTQANRNTKVMVEELNWLQSIITMRIENFLEADHLTDILPEPPEPAYPDTHYTTFITNHALTIEERTIVLLALAPEIQPEILDLILTYNSKKGNGYTSFGGITLPFVNTFVPTVKTALALLGGAKSEDQLRYFPLFEKTGTLFTKGIIKTPDLHDDQPKLTGKLVLTQSALNYILKGEDVHYEYSSDFPAVELTTKLDWEDLILNEQTREELDELMAWVEHSDRLKETYKNGKHLQAGHRAFFWGPPGTGKTLTAALLGKKFNKTVYRIDLSQLVSKYVGETEKNLEKIFKYAENRNWILLFDEADVLFAGRTKVSSSNDRFANQETAYLLQKVETCNNLIILASNLKYNIDKAFTRRFQTIINFPIPGVEERLHLWRGMLPEEIEPDESLDFMKVAQKFDISGGHIANVVRYITLMMLSQGTTMLDGELLLKGIKREYAKIGRTL